MQRPHGRFDDKGVVYVRGTLKRPSPALVVSVLALFVALSGTAGAVVTAAVPLAKRALVSDNAKKLNGFTAKQIAGAGAAAGSQIPGPASTAASLAVVKTSSANIGAGSAGEFSVSCDSGQKVMGGGFSSDGAVLSFGSAPVNDSGWGFVLANADDAASHTVNLYATCLK